MTSHQQDAVKVPQFLKDIDTNLDKYYKQRGFDDYFTRGVGKFSSYCIKHKIHRKNIFVNEELTETIENCSFLDFDPYFPYSAFNMKDHEKKKEVQWIILHCYVYKQPPSSRKNIYLNRVASYSILPTKSLSKLDTEKTESNVETKSKTADNINTKSKTADNNITKTQISQNDKATNADKFIASLTGVATWRCFKCTWQNPWTEYVCAACGHKRAKANTRQSDAAQTDEADSNLPKAYVVKLLVFGFARELSDVTGYEIPAEIEKLFHSYYYLCAHWDGAKVFGYFKVTGFMNECIERTEEGHGSWQNMYSKQIISGKGHYSWKLRVTDMTHVTQSYAIVCGLFSIRKYDDVPGGLHRAFCFYDDGFGKQIDCRYIGQVINVDLDFEYTSTVGLMTIDRFVKCLVPKLYIENENKIERRHYKFALAMGCSGVTLEFFHFGY